MAINKATLAKEINGVIEYIYPKTTADMVEYDLSYTVAEKINMMANDITGVNNRVTTLTVGVGAGTISSQNDAELIDIRNPNAGVVGADTTYNSAGDAVRGQVGKLSDEIAATDKRISKLASGVVEGSVNSPFDLEVIDIRTPNTDVVGTDVEYDNAGDAIRGQIGKLSEGMNGNYNRISTLANTMDTLSNDLDIAEEAINTLSSDINTNKTNITNLSGTVSGHTTTISNHTSSLKTLNDTVSGHTSTLKSHGDSINTNTNNISTNKTSITNLSTTVSNHGTTLTSHGNSITSINNTLKTHGDSINTNKTNITNLSNTVSGHTTTLSSHGTSISNLSNTVSGHTTTIGNHTSSISSHDTSISSLNTSITNLTNTLNTIKNKFDTIYTILHNPQSLNSIYRGKDLGTITSSNIASFITSHRISTGNFTDIYIGDYFTISYNGTNVICRVAAFDWFFYNCNVINSANKSHHIVVVPDSTIASTAMNSGGGVTGGYKNSNMFNYVANIGRHLKSDIFGMHLLETYERVTSGFDSTKNMASMSTNTEVKAILLSEAELFGSNIFSTSGHEYNYSSRGQLPLFKLNAKHIWITNTPYWLRNIVSSTMFTRCTHIGYLEGTASSSSEGVRPRFCIG